MTLADRAQRLKRLSETDGWQELREIFAERKKSYVESLALALLSRDEPVDQRKIDWRAGFIAGCDFILSRPEQTEKRLEEALRRTKEQDA